MEESEEVKVGLPRECAQCGGAAGTTHTVCVLYVFGGAERGAGLHARLIRSSYCVSAWRPPSAAAAATPADSSATYNGTSAASRRAALVSPSTLSFLFRRRSHIEEIGWR